MIVFTVSGKALDKAEDTASSAWDRMVGNIGTYRRGGEGSILEFDEAEKPSSAATSPLARPNGGA